MPKPTTTVEISFNAGYTGTPTWTDVTAYVLYRSGVSATHWRGDEDSDCQPSTLSLTLNNSDGRFTPGNASGAYYPNVKKARRIRVRSTTGGVTYDRFNGYINDWRVDWPATVGAYSECGITATSRMARLGNGVELRSIVEEEILVDAPIAYYTMGEPAGATSANDSSGNSAAPLTPATFLAGTAVSFGVATGPGTDGLTAATFAGNYLTSKSSTPAPSAYWMECFFNTTIASLVTLVSTDEGSITMNAGIIFATLGGAATSAVGLNDGLTHHVLITGDTASGNALLYVDGSHVMTGAGVVGLAALTTLAVGAGPFTGANPGTIAHVAHGTSLISAARAAAHAGSGLTGFAGETPGARITRYASFAGVTATDVIAESGMVPDLVHIDTTGRTALDMMRTAESTEGGVLFDGLDGKLAFHDRTHRYGVGTFGDGTFGDGIFGGGPDGSAFTLSYTAREIASAPSPVLDDQQQVNDMTTATSDGLATAHVTNATSLADHGPYRQSLDLATTDPDEPLLRASWVVNRHAEPLTRISEVEVLLNTASATLTAALLDAELGTMFTLSGLPANAPASTMSLFIEGMSETITGDEHRITLRTSPASLYAVFRLDDPDQGLDSGYPLAY